MKKTTLPKQLPIIPLLLMLALSGNSQALFQSFDSPTFPPPGWVNVHIAGDSSAAVWERATDGAQGGDINFTPFFVDPHSGSGMATFNCYGFKEGNAAFLGSPAINLSGKGAQIVTFWMYRDDGYTYGDSVSVYINTVQNLSGAAFLGKVQRYILNDPAEDGGAGWYKYSFEIPLNYNTANNYILFNAVSQFGNNIFIDDITVEDNPVALCSGTPEEGTISSPGSVCPGVPFTLTNLGATREPGVHYAWQLAGAAGGPWTNIPGQTSFDKATGLTQTNTNVWYRLVDTCTISGLSAISNVLQVTVNAPNVCYCKPPAVTLHSVVDDNITNVVITGTTLNASTGTDAVTGYTEVPSAPATNTANLQRSTVYNITAAVSGGPTQVSAWVDFNRNGMFETNEFFDLPVSGSTASGNITVPANAVAGQAGLRLRSRTSISFTNADACTPFGSGETEDYLVTIVTTVVYTFTGNGNWNDASNWSNNTIPPATLPTGNSIVINHTAGGQCILNTAQTVAAGASLTVLTGKNLIIQGQLSIQ